MEASTVLVHLVTKDKRVTVSINILVYKDIILYTTGREVLIVLPHPGPWEFPFCIHRPKSSNLGPR